MAKLAEIICEETGSRSKIRYVPYEEAYEQGSRTWRAASRHNQSPRAGGLPADRRSAGDHPPGGRGAEPRAVVVAKRRQELLCLYFARWREPPKFA